MAELFDRDFASDFDEATQIFSRVTKGYPEFWAVAGGWAIDFYLGRKTRSHEDYEIVVLRDRPQILFSHFGRLHPQKIYSGPPVSYIDWDGGAIEETVIQMRLKESLTTQNGKEFDLLLTPSQNGEWICRRDESLRLPYSEAIVVRKNNQPLLKPEIVLLFKAKYLRKKDQSDFAQVLPELSAPAQKWLIFALKKIHPGHEWIQKIELNLTS